MAEDKRLEQPLSAAEIEELRELEAKATPGVWYLHNNGAADMVASTGSNWPVALKPGDNDGHLICAMRNALPRLLSMLQPPADAEVREAVDAVLQAIGWADMHQQFDDEIAQVSIGEVRTLLSYVRAAQSPRLTVPDLAVRNVLLSGFPKHMQSHAASEYTTLEMVEKLVELLRTAERVRDENIQRWMRAEKSPRLTDAQVAALHIAQLRCLEEGNLSDVVEILESAFRAQVSTLEQMQANDSATAAEAVMECVKLRAQVEVAEQEMVEYVIDIRNLGEKLVAAEARATRAEAELAECKHELSSLRNTLDDLVTIQRERAEKAEAERDEARGRCERLREVAKSATDRLVCDASCPARITGAEVDCTCGLVAVYDALDAALAECGEVA